MSGLPLGWYVRRLRRMTPGEVASRAVDEGRRRLWARRQVRPGVEPPPAAGLLPGRAFAGGLPAATRGEVPDEVAAAVVAAAGRVLDGTWTVFGVPRPDSAAPDWFLDPVTGRRAPAARLAFAVNQRDEASTGNVKQVWEMSRHHHLTVLAAAWWVTGEERYAQAVADQLRSWWAANPFLSGVHWTSGIEAAVRLLSWVWIRRLLDDWPKAGDLFENDPDALRQIRWHQEYLAAFVSRGSSANNHVVAEAAGRLAAASAFPWYEESAGWRRDAALLLERELAANTFPSGLNREMATDYHRFVLELALVAGVEADAAGAPLAAGTWQVIARMLDAGVAILDVAGGAPRQGDGDEGRALVVDDPAVPAWPVVLGAGGAVLGCGRWWPPLRPSLQAVLLAALARPHPVARVAQRRDGFADAGMVLLRTPPEDGPEIWCRCDAGPHGFLSIAAHAHADALSIEVRHDGVEILADPGTYAYHGEPEWRSLFRSTRGHNTLEVSGVDQSESGGPFLWVSHARAWTTECQLGKASALSWTGRHDGYRRLAVPVEHERKVSLDSRRRLLTVVDVLDTAGEVPVRLSWHLGADVAVELEGTTAALSWSVAGEPRAARLSLPEELGWAVHRGALDPPSGWYSPGFGRRVPSSSLVGRGRMTAASRLVTTLVFDRPTAQ